MRYEEVSQYLFEGVDCDDIEFDFMEFNDGFHVYASADYEGEDTWESRTIGKVVKSMDDLIQFVEYARGVL